MFHEYPDAAFVADSGRWLPELDLPRYPRLIEGLSVLTNPLGTYVIGCPQPLIFTGSAASWVTTTLFPLLDGTHTVVELATKDAGVSLDQVHVVLKQLYFNGLLEAAEDDTGVPDLPEHLIRQARFLSHHLRITGRHRTGGSAQRAVLDSTVVVAGRSSMAEYLLNRLAADGVGCVQWCPTADTINGLDRPAAPIASAAPLVLCVDENPSPLNDACETRGLTYLPVDLSRLVVGPITLPHLSPCPVCIASQYTPPVPAGRETGVSATVMELLRTALVDRAQQLAIGWLSWTFPNTAAERVEVWRIDADGFRSECHIVTRLPRCQRCGDPSVRPTIRLASGHSESAAMLYHHSASIKPWHLQQPAIQQIHLRGDVAKLTIAAHEDNQVCLPSKSRELEMSQEQRSSSDHMNIRALKHLLHICFGTRPASQGEAMVRRRYVASGGNLASPTAFVVVRAVQGTEQGLYQYMPNAGELVPISKPCIDDHLQVGRGQAVVILTARLTQLCEKYGERGYLYAMLDAGLVLHRIRLVSDESGLVCSVDTGFNDEAVNKLLSFDGLTIVPMAIISLCSRGIDR